MYNFVCRLPHRSWPWYAPRPLFYHICAHLLLLGLVPCNFLTTCDSGSSTMLMDLHSLSCSVHSRAMRPIVGLAVHLCRGAHDCQNGDIASRANSCTLHLWLRVQNWDGEDCFFMSSWLLRIIDEMDCSWCKRCLSWCLAPCVFWPGMRAGIWVGWVAGLKQRSNLSHKF